MLQYLPYFILAVLVILLVLAAMKMRNNKQAELRTEEVFNREKYKDLLTIRYFHLIGPKDKKGVMGDSIFIETPDGKTLLIDAGVPDAGSQVLEYLHKLGVTEIDLVINTHPHIDHIGGFATVLPAVKVKQLYMENLPYPASNPYKNTMRAIEEAGIPYSFLEEGDEFKLGADLKFEVLNPAKGELPDAVQTFKAPEINHHALVMKMTYKNQTFLLPADIYVAREAELVEKKREQMKADFLHAPHHGWRTSSSQEFIDAVAPQIVVASNDKIGHDDVRKRYLDAGVKLYSTGLQGNILITSDGNKLHVITEKN